jgi:hypothetical protein
MDSADAALAVSEATLLIDADPTRAAVWGARARAHVLAGDLDRAALDYRQALTLQRGAREYVDEAVSTLAQLGRGCDAAVVLADFLRTNYSPPSARVPFIERARGFWADPGCAAYGGSGSATLYISDSGESQPVQVVVGTARVAGGRFVFDEKYRHPLLIRRAAAARLDIRLSEATLMIPTPSGVTRATLAAEHDVRILGATVEHVVIGVVDDLPKPPDVDGVIGLDLVRRFHQQWTEPNRLSLSRLHSWSELSTEGPLDDIDDVNNNAQRERDAWESAAEQREETGTLLRAE